MYIFYSEMSNRAKILYFFLSMYKKLRLNYVLGLFLLNDTKKLLHNLE